ncbi:unnamed protein product [Closterium sp. Naga37s-1]|nr:unnamed protein product [Closterium sp. Naga37s-1]
MRGRGRSVGSKLVPPSPARSFRCPRLPPPAPSPASVFPCPRLALPSSPVSRDASLPSSPLSPIPPCARLPFPPFPLTPVSPFPPFPLRPSPLSPISPCARLPFPPFPLAPVSPRPHHMQACSLHTARTAPLGCPPHRSPKDRMAVTYGLDSPSQLPPKTTSLPRGPPLYPYGLDSPALLPPKSISLARNLPPPAHLEDCTARTSARQGAERAGAAWAAPGGNGSSLAMTRTVQRDMCLSHFSVGQAPALLIALLLVPSARPFQVFGPDARRLLILMLCCCSPSILPLPLLQVYGPDDSSLALTRTVQRDIWLSQFPPGSCDGKRLLIVPWVLPGTAGQGGGAVEGLEAGESGSEGLGGLEGLGLQVHVMGALLGLAVETGRVLVPLSGSFSYANNSACKAMGQQGQWGCYFSPIASSDCSKRAQKEMQSGSLRSRCSGKHIRNVALSAEPIVCLHPDFDHNELKLHAAVVTKWGAPHLQRPDTLYRPTCHPPTPDNPSLSVPQATRFLMRWPSLHLCHVTNLIRHVSISHHVAARLAFFEDTQAEIIRDVAADTAGESARSDVRKSKQAKELQGMELGKGVEIESVNKASWATIGGRCSVCEEEGWKGEVMMAGGGVGESWDMQAGVSSANVQKAGLEKKEKHVLYFVQKQNNLVVGVGREPYVMRPLASLIIGGTSGDGKGAAGGNGGGEAEVEGRRLEEEEDELLEGEVGAEGNGGEEGKGAAEGKVGGAEVKAGARIVSGGAGGGGGGGGGNESGMLSALMHEVHQLRLVEPHLAHVWLHTPSQALITEATNYRDWTFLHSTNQTSPAPTALQDSGAAAEPAAEARALASLLVASQGDFFVGGLRSHWARLVNELRSTNGRLFNVFVAMDDDEL